MKENKFGVLLNAFKDKDWAAYHKFSKSRYGENTDHQKVMDYIKKHKSRFDPKKMDTEFLRNKVRPDTKPIVFSNVISQLCKHIEAYYIWAEVMLDPMMEDTLLLKAYARRGLTDQFHKQKKKAKINRDKQTLGLWNHYHEFMGEYLTYFCNMTKGISDGKAVLEKSSNELAKFEKNLNGYLTVEKHNRSILINEDWNINFDQQEINLLKTELELIYFHLKNLKEFKNNDSYQKLKHLLLKSNNSEEIKYTIIIHITSYLNGQIIKGNTNLGLELLDLYEWGIESGYLFPNGKIPITRYMNIVTLFSNIGGNQKAHYLVSNYSKMVPSSSPKDVINLGLAQIALTNNEYEKVLLLLRNHKFKEFEFEHRAKWFLLVANFELSEGDTSLIESSVYSFLSFARRNKLNTTKATYSALINCGKFVLMLSKEKKVAVKKAINLEKNLFYRTWFKSKLE